MKSFIRFIFFVLLLFGGVGFCFVIYQYQEVLDDTGTQATFAPLFQLAGRGTKHLDRLITKMTLLTKEDEKEFGIILAQQYENNCQKSHLKDRNYVQAVVANISKAATLSFDYKVFINSSSYPNAYALPGGIIFVTLGLLKTLKTEAQLVSILAHEIGHVELGHCADMVKFEIALKKLKISSGSTFFDFLNRLVLGHSFSKTQENEADEYAFELIQKTNYDPLELSAAFKLLLADTKHIEQKTIIGDYLQTHPDISLRCNKFYALAKRWWLMHQDAKRYLGKRNLKERKVFKAKTLSADEWVTYKTFNLES